MINSITANDYFQKRLEQLIVDRHNFDSSLEFSFRLSELYNHEIISIAGDVPPGLTIAAIGGFGRMELSPYSDIDITFLSYNPEEHSEYIGRILRDLWDRDIKAAHTVRDFNQIYEFAKNDLTSFTQFLELRFVTGSKNIFFKFSERVLSVINSELKKKILQNLLTDIERRHSIYGVSPLLLEPNIKQTAGGLRDLHASAWIYYIITNTNSDAELFESYSVNFLHKLIEKKFITHKKLQSVRNAYEYLLKIRNEIHALTHFKKDKLDFQNQLDVAIRLLPESDDKNYIHNHLMKEYFRSTEVISNFLQAFIKKALIVIYPLNEYSDFNLDENFSLQGKFLKQKKNQNLSLIQILTAYFYRAKFSALFSEELEERIIKSASYFDGTEIENVEISKIFRKILQYPENVCEVLIHMCRTDILGIVQPEFENLRRFFQPNAYHIYTADEHTLIALQNLSKLSIDNTGLGEIYRSYDDKETLFLAILFHDIAKPHNLAGHEILGSQIAETIMQRLGYDDEDISLVSFLVMNHLFMEQTAFRRNLNDALILNEFRKKFNSLKALDFLYLLTYADLSAVNPSSWTAWKNSLLSELYLKTRQMILDNILAEDLLTQTIRKVDFSQLQIGKKEFLDHIDLISDEKYLYTFSDREIAQHVKEIQNGNEVSITYKNDSDLPQDSYSRRDVRMDGFAVFAEAAGFTYLTVITKDRPALLSKICGSIAISDANIHDASIFTRKDNIAIDTFKLTDFVTHRPLSSLQLEILSENITKVLLKNYDLTEAFNEHNIKWKRIQKKLDVTSSIEISFENHPIYTIIDIHCSDRVGLLYLIAKKFSELGLNIFFAKIGTKLNGVFDSFYVLNENLQKIPISQYEFYRDAISESLRQFTNSSLDSDTLSGK